MKSSGMLMRAGRGTRGTGILPVTGGENGKLYKPAARDILESFPYNRTLGTYALICDSFLKKTKKTGISQHSVP